jgi:hypothetical protein
MARVQLRGIVSPADRAAVMGLRRGPGQDQYLNSMEEIFAEADQERRADAAPVGGARRRDRRAGRLRDDQRQHPAADRRRPRRPVLPVEATHRPPAQCRGYGAATLDAVVDYLRTRPGADVLYTSCADGPGSPHQGSPRSP